MNIKCNGHVIESLFAGWLPMLSSFVQFKNRLTSQQMIVESVKDLFKRRNVRSRRLVCVRSLTLHGEIDRVHTEQPIIPVLKKVI